MQKNSDNKWDLLKNVFTDSNVKEVEYLNLKYAEKAAKE